MKTILVVDDEPSIRESLQILLSEKGYKIVTAENGSKGIREFERSQPDVVLTDIIMPDMEGIEFLKTIRRENADRVIIEISDDGKGIDPQIMKRKAYEKGFVDENTMERMSDHEAINLVFAAGLSTVDVVSDLSGRGVGMDVVRSAVDACNGSIDLSSEPGKGTSIQISLPLSMAVTQVMIIESDGQLFGVPMDYVVETVRIPRSRIRSIKRARTTMLRGRLVPLKSLNSLLGLSAEPLVNPDDEIAVLVVKLGTESVGLMVDDFRETLGIIQKPLEGAMGRIAAYSGSAIIGDGSILMILNMKGVL